MVGISQVRPNPSGPRKRQFSIQHFHAGVVRCDHFGFKQDFLRRPIQRIGQFGHRSQPSAHRFPRDPYAVPLEHLFLTVQWLMIRKLADDHVGQHARPRRALLNRLRRFVRCLYRAIAGVFQSHVLDNLDRGGDELVAFAGFFLDEP